MVAEVRAPNVTFKDAQGQHQMPLDPRLVEHSGKTTPSGNCAKPVMINQQSNFNPASAGTNQGFVEWISGVIPRGLEVQDIYVMSRLINLARHRFKSLVSVTEKLQNAPMTGRERGLFLVEPHQ